MCAGPAAAGMRCSTQIVTCSNLSSSLFAQLIVGPSPGGKSVTSIEQRDVQSVLAGIDDLLPLIAKRAQATEDLRRLPDETVRPNSTRSASSSCSSPSSGAACSAIRRCSTRRSAASRARAVPPAGSARSSACTTGTWPCSTSRRRKRCGARTRPCGSPRRMRRWAQAPSSTAATWSTARGTGRRDVTTPHGRSSAAR